MYKKDMSFADIPILFGGCLLIIGTWIAYGTQTFRVIYTRSGEGVSPWQPTFNYIGSYFLAVGVLVLKGRDWFGPVSDLISLSSVAQTVPFFQIAVSIPLSIALLVTLLWALKTKETVCCVVICGAHTFVGLLSCALIAFLFSEWLEVYGQVCCLLASLTTMITWLPQIMLVLTRRTTGELSLVFLLFEFFGSATTVLYQALPWLGNEPWTAWLPEFVLFSQQFILVCLWTWFNRRIFSGTPRLWKFIQRRRAAKAPSSESSDDISYELVPVHPPCNDESAKA